MNVKKRHRIGRAESYIDVPEVPPETTKARPITTGGDTYSEGSVYAKGGWGVKPLTWYDPAKEIKWKRREEK